MRFSLQNHALYRYRQRCVRVSNILYRRCAIIQKCKEALQLPFQRILVDLPLSRYHHPRRERPYSIGEHLAECRWLYSSLRGEGVPDTSMLPTRGRSRADSFHDQPVTDTGQFQALQQVP